MSAILKFCVRYNLKECSEICNYLVHYNRCSAFFVCLLGVSKHKSIFAIHPIFPTEIAYFPRGRKGPIYLMMTSSNGNIIRVTGHMCGEFTGESQCRWGLIFSLICPWINDWANNREAGYLRCHNAHYGFTVMLYGCWYRANARNRVSCRDIHIYLTGNTDFSTSINDANWFGYHVGSSTLLL